jgi:beta-lactamase superfamily II metal-dependent hydrolase
MASGRRLVRPMFLAALALAGTGIAFGQANGKLQIHYVDVGQGDAAVLISPLGQVVLLDDGVENHCDKPVSYLAQIGLTKVDYHIATHYHNDHIGCAQEVLTGFPLLADAYDRGGTYYSTAFTRYLQAVGSHRTAASALTVITLDGETPDPVVISVVALNGNGIPTTNENDLSVVSVIQFGHFRAEIGGDLSGYNTGDYDDIETSVAPNVGRVDVYKVHHHCSAYSSNEAWLTTVAPRVGIVSAGDGNSYGHPTASCLERLHTHGVHTYWTENGAGAAPVPGWDVVSGSVVVEVAPDALDYTVRQADGSETIYATWDTSPEPTPTPTFRSTPRSRPRRHLEQGFRITPTSTPPPATATPTVPLPTTTPTVTSTPVYDPIVYVTETGTKYHVWGCQYLSKSAIAKHLSEVCGKYEACSVCHPPPCR